MLARPFDTRPAPVLSVTAVTRELKDLLEDQFASVWVEGEVSNWKVVQSGHAYFTLKDAHAQLRAVMFRSALRHVPFTPESGMHVVAHGRVTVYEPRGDYQLLAETLEPKGVGALQLALEQLKERLFQEGLFDEQRKRPLPLVPQRIGVLTSPTGAAIRDIIQVVQRRRTHVHLYLYPAHVQGREAVPDLVRGLAALNAWQPRLDVLIVGRGGGSLEDLWAFNDEQVVRAMAASAIPVISAVGHEIDYTLADFVADRRAPTPSAAAELVVKSDDEIQQQLQALHARMQTVMQQTVRQAATALERLRTSRVLREPQRLLEARQQYVDDLHTQLVKAWQRQRHERQQRVLHAGRALSRAHPRARWQRLHTQLQALQRRLETAMRTRLSLHHEHLHGLGSTLHSLSPLAVLGRGYSLCRVAGTQRLVTHVSAAHPGQQVEVVLHDGHLACTVDAMQQRESDGGGFDLRASLEALRGHRRGAGNGEPGS